MAIVGDVLSLIQTDTGQILAGTGGNNGTIYHSNDDGQTWTAGQALGDATTRVNALAKNNLGHLFAAVSHSTNPNSDGVWRSTNHGASWTKVHSHTNGGILDIAYIPTNNYLVAVGFGHPSQLIHIPSSGDGGNTWQNWGPFSDVALPYYRIAASEVARLAFYVRDLTNPQQVFWHPGYEMATYSALTAITADVNDIITFGFRNASGVQCEGRIVAARRGGQVEIWRYSRVELVPLGPTANNSWARVATVAETQFNVLYVDTSPDHTSTQRTIWAGANGKIYVSYNSGITWALATDAPTGQIYSFVRTASGVLIAGGAAGEILRFDGGSGDDEPPEEPDDPEEPEEPEDPQEPDDPSFATTRFLGRSATCSDEVYVANKFSSSNVTHIVYYNGSQYINLQFGAEPPYSLLGATPDVGRAVYFGSRTGDSNIPAGPFSSLILNIAVAAVDVTVVWEYWDGSKWEALDVQDNSAGFSLLGVQSVHWVIPSDWDTTIINGVTGYWVRARVSAVGSNPSGPVHSSRYIYTANLPYVEIAEDEVNGDLPAAAQVLWRNQADNPVDAPDLVVHRLLAGLRRYSRGRFFEAYINLSDVQTPFGVTVTNESGSGGFEDALRAPTGRRYSVSYTSDLNQWHELVSLTLSTTIARDYFGDFRVFLRGYIAGGDDDDWRFRLSVSFGSGGLKTYSKVVYGKPAQVDWRLFDLGSVRIPNTVLGSNQVGDEMALHVEGYPTTSGVTAKLYDLIFIPTDEWAGDFLHGNADGNQLGGVTSGDFLDIDSLSNPKTDMVAYNRTAAGLVRGIWQPITNGPVMLQVRARQRLWFLTATYDAGTKSYGAYPEVTGSVQINKAQRYLGLRGER